MSENQSSLARLVLFMICLAIAGSIIAGVHYFVVDHPQQQGMKTPANGLCEYSCYASCVADQKTCEAEGGMRNCLTDLNACENSCIKTCKCSDCQDQCNADFNACTDGSKTCMRQYQSCEQSCPCSS
jgi:hypothetical protein